MPDAARIGDLVEHALPPGLMPGPASPDVIIGYKPAWRGLPAAMVAGLQAAKDASDKTIETAEKATLAAAGTPGAPAAKTAEETTKATAATTMGTAISSAASSSGADTHTCAKPLPIPPHGPGVVIDGSKTVFINYLPACRKGDHVLEAVGPPNEIKMGEPTVIIGDDGDGSAAPPSPASGGGAVEGDGDGGDGGGGGGSGPSQGTAQGQAMSGARAAGAPFCQRCAEAAAARERAQAEGGSGGSGSGDSEGGASGGGASDGGGSSGGGKAAPPPKPQSTAQQKKFDLDAFLKAVNSHDHSAGAGTAGIIMQPMPKLTDPMMTIHASTFYSIHWHYSAGRKSTTSAPSPLIPEAQIKNSDGSFNPEAFIKLFNQHTHYDTGISKSTGPPKAPLDIKKFMK